MSPAILRGGLILWVAAVAVLTLRPGDPVAPGGPFLCFPCGEVGSADAVLNVILFLPLGAVTAWWGAGWWVAMAAGFGGSALIEAVQTALPGRFPTAADVVVNGLGALLGYALVRGGLRRFLRVRPIAAAAAAALVLTVAGAWPVPTPGALYGQHTPALGDVPAWDGTVEEARVGGRSVPSRRVDDPADLRHLLADQAPVEVRFRMGSRPPVWTPVFAVFSGDREEALFVAVRGSDLSVRARTLARSLRFRSPRTVLPEALEGTGRDETVTLHSQVEPGGRCLEAGDRRVCHGGVGPAEGWRFLLGGDDLPPALVHLLSFLQVALAAGLLFASRGAARERWVLGAALLALALLLPWLTPLAAAGSWTVVAGTAAGAVSGRILRRHVGASG